MRTINRTSALMRSLLGALACSFLLAPAAPAQATLASAGGPALAPGDVIKIEVFRNKELSCECPIAADGSIVHPLYRELRVVGVPLATVEARLRTFLAQYEQTPAFVITPLLRVIAAGEVRQPSIYTVPPGTTVAQLIAMAGGPSERGRLDQVRVLRSGSAQTLDLTRPDLAASQIEVHSGDQVVVGRKRNLIQDYIGPSSSILAALAAVTGVIIQLQRK